MLPTKRKTIRKIDSMLNLVLKKLMRKHFLQTVILKTKMIASTQMIPTITMNSDRKTIEEGRKLLPLYLESTKELEKLSRMIQCFSKMKSLPLSHCKERFGQILKLLAVLHSNLKVHTTTPALLSATLHALRKDLL